MQTGINVENLEKVLLGYENVSEIADNVGKILDSNIPKIELLDEEYTNLFNELESVKHRIEVLNIEKIELNNKILNPATLSIEKNSLKDELNDLRIEIDSLENHNEFLTSAEFRKHSELINIGDMLLLDSYLGDKLEALNKKFKVLKENYDELNPNKTEMDIEDNLNELCYKSYELSTLEKKIIPTSTNMLAISTEMDKLLDLTQIKSIKSFYNDGMAIDDIQKIFESYNIKEVVDLDLDLDIPDEFILNMDFKYE